MSDTIGEIERKLDVAQIVRDHPWPALALAVGAGILLSGSSSDVKAAAATVAATKGASSKLGDALDEIMGSLVGGVHDALDQRVNGWVSELKGAIGAPTGTHAISSSSSVPVRAD